MNAALKRMLPASVRKSVVHTKHRSTAALSRAVIGTTNRLMGPAASLCMIYETLPFTPELVVQGYMQGIFPSAIHTSGAMRWHDPDPRGVLSTQNYHVEKETRRIIRQNRFEIRVDHDLRAVMNGCATPKAGRETTFILPEIVDAYLRLHAMGVAHCVEAYQDGVLVGGLYGVAIGGYFAGESQFHEVANAGKVAFVYLLEILRERGFVLHDTWWGSKHLEIFGGTYIPRDEFKRRLARALTVPATFGPLEGAPFAERF
jgi:leucyl/phenylalanyl-tRNA--protein transferase